MEHITFCALHQAWIAPKILNLLQGLQLCSGVVENCIFQKNSRETFLFLLVKYQTHVAASCHNSTNTPHTSKAFGCPEHIKNGQTLWEAIFVSVQVKKKPKFT